MTDKRVKIMLLQELNQYCASRVSNITKYFLIASRNGNQDAIHELRVEIKRLRSFFELMKAIGVKFDFKEIFTPIRDLFKLAALIRDAQVLQNLSREVISSSEQELNVSEYINLLKQKEMAGIKDFLKIRNNFNLSMLGKIQKMIRVKLSKMSSASIAVAAKAYEDNLIDSLNPSKMKRPLEETDFHNIRILIKKSRYTLEMVASCYSKSEFELYNDRLRGVHQPLGQWHDTDIAIFFLKDVIADQSLRPFFSDSSYTQFMKLMEERREHYGQLFLNRLNLLDFHSCSVNGAPAPEEIRALLAKPVEDGTGCGV